MPMVLRMKHVVKSADLGNPTIEQLYQMYRTSPVPILQKQAAEITIRLNANPDDPTNIMASAGIGETAVSMEESGPGPAKPPGRTASLLRDRRRKRSATNSGHPRLNVVFRSAFSRPRPSEVGRLSERRWKGNRVTRFQW